MKKIMLAAMVLAAAWTGWFIPPAVAGENQTPNGGSTTTLTAQGKAEDKRITVRLRGVPLTTLLNVISEQAGFRFSFSDSRLSKQNITIFMKNARPAAILELLAKSKDLEFQRLGSDNYVVSKNTAPFAGFPPMTRQDIEDPALNQLVSVRLRDASLASFLDIVSEQSRINFVITEEVYEIPITVDLSKITVLDVLQFLKAKGLSYSRVSDTNTFVVRAPASGGDNKMAEADKAFGDKKYEKAIATYKDFLEAEPDSEMGDYALLQMAVGYDWIAARDNDASALKEEEKLLNRLIKVYPESFKLGDAYLYLGQIYSGHGGAAVSPINCRKAIELFNLAIKHTYRDWVKAQAGGRIAQCYERSGDKEKAAAIYREVVGKYPDTPFAMALRKEGKGGGTMLDAGAALEGQGEYALAIEVYEKIVKTGSPANSVRRAELRIGICQAAMKDLADAIETFDAYIAKYEPELDGEAFSQIAQALEKAGRPEVAKKYLEKARGAVRAKN
ncbi:MAG: tetratricopeptide repeat protein [Elusimicrobia bacterium]|nr:tetratricopeptide repeat protein [Elusimicrobiota bacterium]